MVYRRKWLIPLTLVALALGGCVRLSKAPSTPTPHTTAAGSEPGIGPRSGSHTVAASGELVPAKEADIGFTMSGRVATAQVAEGDDVEAGEVLVMLEADALAADVARAEAALMAAQAELLRLKAVPPPQAVAAAEARLAAAEAALTEATAQRDELTSETRAAAVAAAQARVTAAEADWMTARIDYDQLQNRKQEDRKSVKDWEEEEARLRRQAAELSRNACQLLVAQTWDRSRVEVCAAQAVVSTTLGQRDVAQAQLALLQAGASAEEIAAAEAAVMQAEAALEAARAVLNHATLRAPFGGTVTTLKICPGETVLPGQAVLTLANLRHLQVETTDMSERDVGQVTAGQAATVYVEALDSEIGGRVIDVAPRADTVGGDVVFAVTIALDEQPPGLRWGMSVEVEI